MYVGASNGYLQSAELLRCALMIGVPRLGVLESSRAMKHFVNWNQNFCISFNDPTATKLAFVYSSKIMEIIETFDE